jgi:hypothetical protein
MAKLDDEDDDILTGPVPAPDAEASGSERMRAKGFADLVDKAIAGRTLPPAMSADDRALLEVATVIRAASGNVELPAPKRSALVEAALRQAVGGVATATSGAVVPISRARRRWVPWAVASATSLVAAAAIVLLLVRKPTPLAPPPVAEVPTFQKSRPADPLIGPITRDHVGDASSRIDAIFANRLDGYRDRKLAGRNR